MLNSVPPAPGAPVSDLDIYDPEFAADPYPHMACMRDMGAVVFLEKAGVWAVPRYADVRTVLADHDTFISSAGAGLSNNFKEPPRRPVPTPLLEADPPAHSHDRAIIQRVLSGPALRKLRDAFFAEADRLIAPLVRTGAFDAVTDLAEIFATFISPTALGFDFSPADRERVLYLSSVAFVFFGPKNDYFHQTMRQAPEHLAWVTERCRREHILPGSIGAQIYAAADEGAITEAHAALLVRSVLLASLDNTIAGLGRFLKLLATHPDQWRLIVANPELSRAAFEEMMRFDQPSVGIFRTTARECTIAGIPIPKHEKVFALTSSANRDPAQWFDPDRYDIRRVTVGHVGFGHGIHTCVGMMVARLQAEAILASLARRVNKVEMAGAATMRDGAALRRAYSSVPVRVEPH